jgi:hypothetical protein
MEIDTRANTALSDALVQAQVIVVKDEILMFAFERPAIGSGAGAYGWPSVHRSVFG